MGVWWGLRYSHFSCQGYCQTCLCYNRFIDWGNSVGLSPRQLRGFSFGELSMKLATAINTRTYRAIVPTLKLADISSASLLDTLLVNGVGTRKDAVPYVVFYVS